jgi:hypothetical protein
LELTDLDVLDYLHDADVTSLVYRLDADNRREIVLSVDCHPDSGCPKWDGKRIVIRLHDLILATHLVYGAQAGREEINSWDSRLTPWMVSERRRLAAAGVNVFGRPFSVAFHSGSALAGICKHIFVEVDEPA